jgi:hypothetical protein
MRGNSGKFTSIYLEKWVEVNNFPLFSVNFLTLSPKKLIDLLSAGSKPRPQKLIRGVTPLLVTKLLCSVYLTRSLLTNYILISI